MSLTEDEKMQMIYGALEGIEHLAELTGSGKDSSPLASIMLSFKFIDRQTKLLKGHTKANAFRYGMHEAEILDRAFKIARETGAPFNEVHDELQDWLVLYL